MTTDRTVAPVPLRITGGQLQANIIALAHLYDYKVAHFRPCTTKAGWRTPVEADGKGWPDLVLAHTVPPARIYFWEVKGEHEKVRPEQQMWLDLLGGRVVRPSDWVWAVDVLSGGRAEVVA